MPLPDELQPIAPRSPGLIFKVMFLFVATWFTWGTLTRQWTMSVLHNLHLPIHEAGHLLFTPLGEFMHFLGGSVFQVAFPAAFVVHFARRKEWFSVACVLLWIGESIVDVSYYVGDAYKQELALIGGEHDWAVLLGELDLTHHAEALGNFTFGCGILVMGVGLLWAWQQVFAEGKWIEIKP